MSGIICPWGHWPGTVDAEALAGQTRLTGFAVSADGHSLAWTEHLSAEDTVRLRITTSSSAEAWSPAGVSPRCRIHGYGGRAIWSGTRRYPWLFIQDEDQGIWAVTSEGRPIPIHTAPGCRHGDCDLNQSTGRLVFLQECPADDRTRVLLLDMRTGGPARVLPAPAPFCASPRISPDGRRVAWISWADDEMPWTRSRLWCTELDSGRHEPLTDGDSSIIEPRWARDGALYYLDDRAGWWQLYRQAGDSSVRICDYPADIGRPPWQLAQAHHANARDDGTIAVSVDSARCSLVDIRPSGRVRNIEVQEVDITQLQVRGDDVWYLGSREDRPAAICRVDTDRGTTERVVDEGAGPDPDCVSRPEPVMASGPQGIVHGHLYRPCCPGTRGPGHRPPPLVVRAHGGPTAMRSPAWNPEVQFWTGHGIAVVEVNYGGSSGHGRIYRERLRRRWGIADRDDCICMAKTLAAEGLCDIQEMFIAGNSAGGLTVLNALRHSDLFRAGLCRWAVTDLARLATLTHRFERGYLDFLVGDRKTSASCYAERSPAAHAHEITAPVLLIQGDADRIVPVSQATAMADAMTVNGGKAELHIYPGEGHGLRRAENIRSAAETELAFVRGLIEHQGSG